MHKITVDLTITADEYLKQYAVAGAIVLTKSRDGRSLRFPANILRSFVTHSGVQGSFCITFNDAGKFHSIEPL